MVSVANSFLDNMRRLNEVIGVHGHVGLPLVVVGDEVIGIAITPSDKTRDEERNTHAAKSGLTSKLNALRAN